MNIEQSTPTVPAGYWKDTKGHLVPESTIRPVDKLEDQLVKKLMGYADDLSAQIARFKGHCFDDVAAFMALIAEQYGATMGGPKGNVRFTSYDGCLKVELAVADNLSFGPQLQVAKELIDRCINDWASDARPEIRALVEHAFRTDAAGKVNRDAIFSLRRLQIEDPRWQEAMTAITDSIRIIGSKSYFRFYRRADPQAKWEPVTVALAAA